MFKAINGRETILLGTYNYMGMTFDPDVIARAVRTELERGGQVYFVHNRVESIYAIAAKPRGEGR